MRVTGWSNGKSTYGIRIGIPNRREYFDDSWSSIDIEMDGEVHTFGLTGGFWRRCPEIRDRGGLTIREWLEQHHMLHWPKGQPPSFELTPLGGSRFRLTP